MGTTLLSNDDRTATVELDETVNIRKVHIQSLEVTEGGKASIPSDTVVDLTTPLQITLSLYQDYPWTIIANQTIERIFSVEGQIGQAYFYPDIREASVNLPKDKGLDVISVTDLKLGPSGATYNGKKQRILLTQRFR